MRESESPRPPYHFGARGRKYGLGAGEEIEVGGEKKAEEGLKYGYRLELGAQRLELVLHLVLFMFD